MMPRLDGLALVAALRTDPRTAAVPVLLLSARAGQEASIEGLQAGADDYLVKPFAAAELLARVRANVELARLRNHHARWRTALVDSLQEAFFVCDEHGAVIEINTAFTDILGYGADGLPYEPIQPWWPDTDTDPEGHRRSPRRSPGCSHNSQGTDTVPVTHRDGHRMWVSSNFNQAEDPDTGRRVMVGTFRDVTAEHYAVQRQTALADLNQALAQADTVDEALQSHGRRTAQALAGATRPGRHLPRPGRRLVERGSGPTRRAVRRRAHAVGSSAAGNPREPSARCATATYSPSTRRKLGSAGIALQHPRGVLVVWIELAERRPFTPEDQTLLTVLAGRLGQGLQRVQQLDGSAKPLWRCNMRSWDPPACPAVSRCDISPPRARCRSAATGTTWSTSTTGASR